MYNYFAILEKNQASKETIIKYFKDNDIKVERVYSSLGIIKLVSTKKLNVTNLKHITSLELDNDEFEAV